MAGIRRCCRPSTISKKNISAASGLILIKGNDHWVRGLIALGFGADCVKILVSMETDSYYYRLIIIKTKKKNLR